MEKNIKDVKLAAGEKIELYRVESEFNAPVVKASDTFAPVGHISFNKGDNMILIDHLVYAFSDVDQKLIRLNIKSEFVRLNNHIFVQKELEIKEKE